MLVIVVGTTCSGKTSLRLEFQKRGYFTIEASEQLARCRERYLPEYDSLPLNIFTASETIKEYGDCLGHALLTGLRTVEEFEYYRRFDFNTYLVAIHCDSRECYRRAKSRKREAIGNYEDFMAQRIQPDMDLGLDRLLLKADTILENREIPLQEFLDRGVSLLVPYLCR